MPLRFAYTRPDGGTTVVAAAPKEFLIEVIGKRDAGGVLTLSDEDYRAHVIERSIPKDATNVIELPDDWTDHPDGNKAFRNAWEIIDGKVDVNLAKSREILKEKMRFARAPRLEKLDSDYIRAVEINDEAQKTAIAAEKQKLRDVTALPAIEAAATVDELRTVWPEDILGASPVKKPDARLR